jgi:hypothetical protein
LEKRFDRVWKVYFLNKKLQSAVLFEALHRPYLKIFDKRDEDP